MQKRCYLYCLIDPRCPEHIRYVGITRCDLTLRLYRHLQEPDEFEEPVHTQEEIRMVKRKTLKEALEAVDKLPDDWFGEEVITFLEVIRDDKEAEEVGDEGMVD